MNTNSFHYQNNSLFVENISLTDIANQFGTPTYVYSESSLQDKCQTFKKSFGDMPHQICYAVKANSNLSILNFFAKQNMGFDIVSIGELERVLAAGGNPNKIVFSGVGKQSSEIIRALDVGIFCFNIESEPELERLAAIAKQKNKIANIALRINPNIDARTHPYIATGLHENKFGIEMSEVLTLCSKIKKFPQLKLIGIGCHIGSQLTEMEPFLEALDCLLELVDQLKKDNISLKHIDIGGGLGICYQDETPPSIEEYISALKKKLKNHPELEIILEPGRIMVAESGILLTRVEYLKKTLYKNFAIVDAAMNDLIRPALYDAWQKILPVTLHEENKKRMYDVVGPVCESADFLGKDRELSLETNDLLAIMTAGAYGFVMSSNYNSRPRAAEVMVNGNQVKLIRKRETIEDLFALEK